MLLLKKNKDIYGIRFIAGLGIYGGLFGIISLVNNVSKFPILENLDYLTLIIPLLLIYTLYLVSGIELWKNTKRGFILSIISQCFQILHLNILGFKYVCYATMYLTFYLSSSLDWGFTFKFGSSVYELAYVPEENKLFLGINIIAIILLIILIRKYNDYFKQRITQPIKL